MCPWLKTTHVTRSTLVESLLGWLGWFEELPSIGPSFLRKAFDLALVHFLLLPAPRCHVFPQVCQVKTLIEPLLLFQGRAHPPGRQNGVLKWPLIPRSWVRIPRKMFSCRSLWWHSVVHRVSFPLKIPHLKPRQVKMLKQDVINSLGSFLDGSCNL